jgi:hypothetical protein
MVLRKEKKQMRNFLASVPIMLAFVIAMSTLCQAAAVDTPIVSGRKAAKIEIDNFIKNRKVDKNLQDLGFESQADIDNADLGEGFQIFTFDADKIIDESALQDFVSLVIPTKQWYFLIVAGNKANSLLEMFYVDGNWTLGGIGSTELAKAVHGILEAWPASSGFNHRFIRLYQGLSDFIEISRENKTIGIIPIPPLIERMNNPNKVYGTSDLRNPKEILSGVRPVIKRNIELYKQQKSNIK